MEQTFYWVNVTVWTAIHTAKPLGTTVLKNWTVQNCADYENDLKHRKNGQNPVHFEA